MGSVVVAIRNDLLRYGVERMLQAQGATDVRSMPGMVEPVGPAPAGHILIALLSEVDDDVAAGLRAAEECGVKIVLLIEENAALQPSTIACVAGIRTAGFLTVESLGDGRFSDALSRIDDGELPMPASLARSLIAIAGQQGDDSRRALRITPREREVLGYMTEGLSNRQIARRLGISDHGSKRLVASILAKLDCTNRTQAVVKAMREGL